MRIEFEFVYEAEMDDREKRTYRDVFSSEVRDVDPDDAPVVALATKSAYEGAFEFRHHEGRFLRSFHVWDGGVHRPFRTDDLADPARGKELGKMLASDARAPINVDGEVKRKGRPDPARTKANDRNERIGKLEACAGSPLSVNGVLFLPVAMPRWLYGATRDAYGRDEEGAVLDWRNPHPWPDAVGLGEPDVLEARRESNPRRGRIPDVGLDVRMPELLVSGVDGEAQIANAARELVSCVAHAVATLPLDAMLAYADARDLLADRRYGKPLDDATLEAIDAMLDAMPTDGRGSRTSWQAQWFEIDRNRFGRPRTLARTPVDDGAYEGFTL